MGGIKVCTCILLHVILHENSNINVLVVCEYEASNAAGSTTKRVMSGIMYM